MNEIRARIEFEVKDPATAEALKPWHRRWCKRPLFSDDYLPTFNRPNVTLVDTAGKGIERMTETGVVRSEEHTSELQSLMRISYAVFCLKKEKKIISNAN